MLCDYLITTKKNDLRFVDHVSILMYVFAVAVFIYYYYNAPVAGMLYLIVVISIVITLIFTLYKKRKKGEAFFRLGLLIAACGWFLGSQPNILMGVLYVLAALLEKQVKFPQEICLNKEGITFNTFPKKHLTWTEVVNVVMKDGLITIDQRNNKLYQKEVEGDVTPADEAEFNTYCRSFIETGMVN